MSATTTPRRTPSRDQHRSRWGRCARLSAGRSAAAMPHRVFGQVPSPVARRQSANDRLPPQAGTTGSGYSHRGGYDRPFVRLVYVEGLKMPRSPGRRTEILDAFVRYVAERGYDRTNMGDIADELGMSKGTIVHHFGTKAQMLRELEETHLACQLDVLRMAWDRLAAPHERIAAIIYASALLQVIARNATVASQREVVQLSDDPAMQQVRKLRHQLQTLTIDEIRNGHRERCVPKRGRRTGGIAAVGIAAVDVGVVRSRRFPRHPNKSGPLSSTCSSADCCSTAWG